MSKKAKKRIAACIALCVVIILYAWGFKMQTVRFNVSSDKIDSGLKIVFISDLHNCFYGGKDQSALIEEIENEDPDLVLFGGDVVDQYGGIDNALTIMELASEKYPCCYTPGNHEQWRDDMNSFIEKVGELGIQYLEGDSAEFTLKDQQVKVYGILDAYAWGTSATQLEECLADLDDDRYNILLAHQPEQYYEYLGLDPETLYENLFVENSFDLILSGHAHGGQWRIPGILDQGVYAPDQGIFPEYTNGMYEYGKSVHIISKGLARPLRMIFIPRIFNRPELTVIEIE